MWKEDKPYDEYQLLKRHRIGFQTMIIFASLVAINGFIKEFYIIWAPPMIEALVLLYIPLFYFILMGLFKSAYFRRLDTHFATILMFGLGALLSLSLVIQNLIYGTFTLIADGMLADDVIVIFLVLFSWMVFIAAIVKRIQNRREV